jgi:hypothetical protein
MTEKNRKRLIAAWHFLKIACKGLRYVFVFCVVLFFRLAKGMLDFNTSNEVDDRYKGEVWVRDKSHPNGHWK